MLMDYMETEQSYFFERQPKIFKDLELYEPHETRILSLYYYPVYNISFKKKSNYPQTSQQSTESKMTTQISTKPVWCYLQLLWVNCQEKAFQVVYADLH